MAIYRARLGSNLNTIRQGDNTLYYCQDGVQTTAAAGPLTVNRLYATPLTVRRPFPITLLRFAVTTGVAGNGRAGIYLDAQNGQPGALLVDGGDFDVSGTGNKDATVAVTLPAGMVWLVFVASAAISVTGENARTLNPLGFASDLSSARRCIVRAFTYGALPADESAQAYSASSAATPAVFVRA